ncbi:MAG TPA: NAD(P) transhydrogenase subunit alpha, partial [Nitrososphaerales archaeon]|nr:NAD(P) transhydrogenase subunit alpha [Nitrososphaerales archaeon]
MFIEFATNATATATSAVSPGSSPPQDVVVNLLIFIMATFLGTELIRHVSRLLHTPLMALTNAISSISVVAALIVMSETTNSTILILATVGVALAVTNIVSGYILVERIVRLFKPKAKPAAKPAEAQAK